MIPERFCEQKLWYSVAGTFLVNQHFRSEEYLQMERDNRIRIVALLRAGRSRHVRWGDQTDGEEREEDNEAVARRPGGGRPLALDPKVAIL